MKIKIVLFCFLLGGLVPICDAQLIDKEGLGICVPRKQLVTTSVIAGVATVHNSAFVSDAALVPYLNFSSSQLPYALNHFKGALGESLMDRVFTSSVLKQTGGWSKLTPHVSGRNGIDGLYIRLDALGNPRSVLVADAKMNSARLGTTVQGKQMSDSWIRPRLRQTAQDYGELAHGLKRSKVVRKNGAAEQAAKSKTLIQMNEKTTAAVWNTKDGFAYFCSDDSVTPLQIQKQAQKTSVYINSVAKGNVSYRSRLFTYKAENGQHVITSRPLDSNGNVIQSLSAKSVRGSFDALPKEYQSAIRHVARRAFLEQKNFLGERKFSREEVRVLADKCCRDPESFNKYCAAPRIDATLIRGVFTVGTVSGIAAAVDAAFQYSTTGVVDLRQTAQITCLTGTTTAVGLAVQSGLLRLGCSGMISKLGGGGVTSIAFSYGLYCMGYCSLQDANWGAASGVGSAIAAAAIAPTVYGATYATMYGIAFYFGSTAAGHTAISSLSGAAATNAVLAWWGGGSLAAGGAGVAGGGAVVSTVATGGVIILVASPFIVYGTWKYFSGLKAQEKYLNGLVDLTAARVRQGVQLEWGEQSR